MNFLLDSLELLLGGSMILLLILGILVIASLVLYIVCLYKLFKKAGKKGWEAIIPYYNTWVLIEIAGLNWWYFLIAISGSVVSLIGLDNMSWITTIAGWAVNFFVFYNLAKKFHKNPIGIAVGGVLIPEIMVIVFALSNNFQLDNSVIVSPNGPIDDTKENE